VQEQPTLPNFKRVAQLGLNIIRFKRDKVGETKYLEVRGFGERETKQYGTLPYADVTDLETGEEGILWLDGALKYNFAQFQEKLGLPFKTEIQWTGMEEADVMIDGKNTTKEINTYKFWEISESN